MSGQGFGYWKEKVPDFIKAKELYESETGDSLERKSISDQIDLMYNHKSTTELIATFKKGKDQGMLSLINGSLAMAL